MSKSGDSKPREMWAAVVIVGMAIVAFVIWARLAGWRFGPMDQMSSLGLVVMAAIVGAGLLLEWFQDWRTLRVLRRHLAQVRRSRVDPRGPKTK